MAREFALLSIRFSCIFPRMARYETYRSNAAEAPLMRKWILRALLISLLLHAALFVFFQLKKLDHFNFNAGEQLAPPRFVVNKVTIDPKLLQDPEEIRVKLPAKLPNQRIAIPNEKPEIKEIDLKPQSTEIASPLLTDKPKSTPLDWDAIAKTDAASAGRSDKELGSIATALLNNSVKSPRQPTITLPPGSKDGDGIGGNEGVPGRQSIQDALANFGAPGASDKPVAMPGGALFSHDQAELRPEALDALKKLGQLISLYPDATFVISGHTDWTGSQDYNLRLSERRAEAVRDWLVGTMHVAPDRIQTLGKGSADAIVPAEKSVDEQQPNRRVEIVIKTNKATKR